MAGEPRPAKNVKRQMPSRATVGPLTWERFYKLYWERIGLRRIVSSEEAINRLPGAGLGG